MRYAPNSVSCQISFSFSIFPIFEESLTKLPCQLSFNSASSLQAIHGLKANVKKGDWYKTLDISAGAPSTQMVIDKPEHAVRRRKMAPAFSERALKEAEGLISISARKLAEQIGKQHPKSSNGGAHSEDSDNDNWTTPQNFGNWSTWFGFDFISDLGYGESFGMLDNDANRWIAPVLRSASKFIYYVGYLPFIDLIRPLMGTRIQDYIGGQSAADSLKYTNLANARVAERIALEEKMQQAGEKPNRRDTFHYLLNSKDPATGKGLTREELQADSALVIAAGADGVGLTLSATVFYLIRNPTVLSKLTTEICQAFASLAEIQNPKLNTLTYLSACIDETLRLCPPKASTVPRQVLAGGMEIDGHYIPAGVDVGTPVYVLHHNEEHFPQAWSYKPERWIVADPDGKSVAVGEEVEGMTRESVLQARAALCPFLIGPLNCIGKNMAYFAVKVSLAQLLWRYDIRASRAGEGIGGSGGGAKDLEWGRQREDEYQITDYITGFRDGPIVQLRARARG